MPEPVYFGQQPVPQQTSPTPTPTAGGAVAIGGLNMPSIGQQPTVTPGQNATSAPTDSFGEAITTDDMNKQPANNMPPQFVNGMLPTTASQPAPVASTASTGVASGLVDKKEKNKDKMSGDGKGLPPVVMTSIYIGVVAMVGLGVFALWWYQHQQIMRLADEIEQRNSEIQRLRVEQTSANDNLKISNDLPVYVDPDGNFSFYQKIPSMTVTVKDGMVVLNYDKVSNNKPIDGWVMEMENLSTGGLGLETIVQRAIDSLAEGEVAEDKREEAIGDNIGISYVVKSDDGEEIVYFLQRAAGDNRYMRVSYWIAAQTDADYAKYEKIVFQVLSTLMLYQVR